MAQEFNTALSELIVTLTGQLADHYRRLAVAAGNPAAFEPDLASGLRTYAWVRMAGKTALEEALDAAHKAVEIYRRLAQQFPAVFNDELRWTLRMAADVMEGLGRIDEATEIRRSLVDGG